MQCVTEGAVYVGGAVGALQILKVRARSARLRPIPVDDRLATEPDPHAAGR